MSSIGVRLERDARRAALLRAVVDEAVLARYTDTGRRRGSALVRLAVRELFLEVS